MDQLAFELSIGYPCELSPSGMLGPDEDAFILRIECATGDVYELTVWTDAYFARTRNQDRESGERLSGQYLPLPDLMVSSRDFDFIEQVVTDLIKTQRLRPEWLIPDEYTASYNEIGPAYADEDEPDTDWTAELLAVAADLGWTACNGQPAA